MNIPPALTTKSVEILVHDGELFAISEGRTYKWTEIPKRIRESLRIDLHKNPQALELLRHYPSDERLRIYTKCKFGGFEATPDIDEEGNVNGEHWNCQCSDCPLRKIFRATLEVANGYLTEREIEIAKLIASGYFGKEITARLHICESTLNSHKRSIFQKVGVASSVELTKWAYQINLI